MRLLRLLPLLASVSFAAGPPALNELIQRANDARGGADKWKAVKSIRFTGKAIFGRDRPTEAQWGELDKRPGMIRTEFTMQGLTSVDSAFDGKDPWTFNPFQGRREAERLSPDDARSLADDADFEGPLVDWKKKGHRVEYLGTQDVEGTPAHKLRVTLKDGDVAYLFLDPDSFLEIRRVTERHVRGTEQAYETDYGSYTNVGGLWFPFTLETGNQGEPKQARFVVERVELDVAADDSLFHLPKGSVARAVVAGPGKPELAPTVAHPTAPQGEPAVTSAVVSGLGARNIGSATMSGRIAAVAAVNQDGKTTVYVGSASGGVWKSLDSGTTFKPVFDKQAVQSIGAVTIDPSNPRTVWVGTGEGWTRNSTSIGDGIYKSTDAGASWTRMGLPESERIVRILVHPKNSDVVYACVPGKLWSDSADRGVYKTSDGGKTWSLVLKGSNLSTGCSGLTMDPRNPDTLFAGLWDFRRKGWTFRSGGDGPTAPSGSGLYRSDDGGKSWHELSGSGLPAKPYGRIEVVMAPSDSKILYALIESTKSALFRSADGGKTWQQGDNSQMMIWRPFYFARLVVDPQNPNRLFKPDLALVVSEDGGKSFANSMGKSHGDWHDLWIDPQNPKHIIGGDDGGLWISFDGGTRWWRGANLPVSQFYHVAVDDKDPYQVYGGLQDNSSWVGDSSTPGGISNSRWQNSTTATASGRCLTRAIRRRSMPRGRAASSRESIAARWRRATSSRRRGCTRSCGSTGTRRSIRARPGRACSTSARNSSSARRIGATPGNGSRRI